MAYTTKHHALVDALTVRIRTGVYGPGDRIPRYYELADEFGASTATVRTAILALKAAGLLESHGNEGVYVRTDIGGAA